MVICMKRRKGIFLFWGLVLVVIYTTLECLKLIPEKIYYDSDFGYERIKSNLDVEGDSIDDYQDILEGARIYVKKNSPYKSAYYSGGYPTNECAICADVIWYAFQNAGYDLKKMVDENIKNYPEVYSTIEKADPNIDFRRVKNLKIFFDRHAISLTLNTKKNGKVEI